MLGRLVCMYVRIIELKTSFQDERNQLTEDQMKKLVDLNEILREDDTDDDEIDGIFHQVLKTLFFWHESRRIMNAMECPIQRFLIFDSVENGAKGFINVKEIGRIIAKLIYEIRSCIYTELMLRCKAGIEENKVDKELGGLMIYDKDMVQTPFGFLREIMHFAASVTSNAGTLPNYRIPSFSPWMTHKLGCAVVLNCMRVKSTTFCVSFRVLRCHSGSDY